MVFYIMMSIAQLQVMDIAHKSMRKLEQTLAANNVYVNSIASPLVHQV